MVKTNITSTQIIVPLVAPSRLKNLATARHCHAETAPRTSRLLSAFGLHSVSFDRIRSSTSAAGATGIEPISGNSTVPNLRNLIPSFRTRLVNRATAFRFRFSTRPVFVRNAAAAFSGASFRNEHSTTAFA